METICRSGSKLNTRVEFKKDNQGLILCFKKQNANDVIDSKTYRSEKAAKNWAVKVLA